MHLQPVTLYRSFLAFMINQLKANQGNLATRVRFDLDHVF